MSPDARRLIAVAALLAIGALAVWSPAIAERFARVDDNALSAPAQAVATGGGVRMFVADTNWWMRTPDQSMVASRFDMSTRGILADFPLTIGDWVGQDVPSDSLQTLGFGDAQQISRAYNGQGERFLLLRLLAASNQMMFYHVPSVCYGANGWELGPEITYPIPIGKTVLSARGFVARQGQASHLVLYFFLWPEQYRSMDAGATMFELVAPVDGDEGAALRPMREFIRLVFADTPELAAGSADMPFSVDANLGGKVALVGYDLSSTELRPGETLTVALAWQARGPIDEDYTVFVHVLNRKEDQAVSMVMAQDDTQPFRGLYPTSRWRAGQVLRDTHEARIPDDAAPGERQVEVGMYLLATGRRLDVVDASGQALGDNVMLQPVRIMP